MCTLPLATSGTPVMRESCRKLCKQSASSSPSSNSTHSHRFDAKRCLARIVMAQAASKEMPGENASKTSHPVSIAQCGSGHAMRYWPLGAERRASVMNSHKLPQPCKCCGNTTTLKPGSANSAPGNNFKPSFFASVWARTRPATEHSSVSASAA